MNREVCMIEIVRWSTYPIQWRRLEVGDPAISIMYRTANFEVHGRDRGLGPTIKIVRPVSRLWWRKWPPICFENFIADEKIIVFEKRKFFT